MSVFRSPRGREEKKGSERKNAAPLLSHPAGIRGERRRGELEGGEEKWPAKLFPALAMGKGGEEACGKEERGRILQYFFFPPFVINWEKERKKRGGESYKRGMSIASFS